MNRSIAQLVFLALLALGAHTILSACKSEPYQTGAATGKTVQQAADEIDHSVVLLDDTVRSLEELVAHPTTDPAPQFKVFTKTLSSLESEADDVRSLAVEMEKRGDSYFTEWDQQIAAMANEDIRSRSQARRAEVSDSLKKISARYSKARDELQPLLSDLQDVRSALAADLTPNGIDSVKKPVDKLGRKAEDVKETLTALAADFRKLGVDMGTARPASAPPPK